MRKKIILGALLITVICVCSAFSFWFNKSNEVALTSALLCNVEALANPEGGDKIECDDFYNRETCVTITVTTPHGGSTTITVSGRKKE